mgnify:CR=1 FL=1
MFVPKYLEKNHVDVYCIAVTKKHSQIIYSILRSQQSGKNLTYAQTFNKVLFYCIVDIASRLLAITQWNYVTLSCVIPLKITLLL